MRPIGYYVHHQGVGHWQRATALARLMRRPCVLLGSIPAEMTHGAPCPVVALPDDAPAGGDYGDIKGVPGLHFAPLGHDGLRRRAAMMASWIAGARPALMVIDVSVEAAILSRLLSTPFLYFRLAGLRDDPPHLAAFRAAEALIAPYPPELEAEGVPDWVAAKTFHSGFLSTRPTGATDGGGIVTVFGRGGAAGNGAALAAAARATPGRRWQVIGPATGTSAPPPNLEFLGWREDASQLIAGADLIIGGAGDGLVSEVAAFGKRFLCLPEPRPFGEQLLKARRLAALGAAILRETWPEEGDWPALLREVDALDPARITALYDAASLARTAAFVDAEAERAERYGQ
jgi:hypothetical protein